MLRCTPAGLIPLMNSRKYGGYAEQFLQDNAPAFQGILQHKSYYLLRSLPAKTASILLTPVLPQLAARQTQSGLWRGKDGEKITYDILSALARAGIPGGAAGILSPLPYLRDRHGEYALLIKRTLGEPFTEEDSRALAALTREILSAQAADGSFGETVTGTVIHLDRLLDLGLPGEDPAIQKGARFLLSQRQPSLQGMHTDAPYGLTAADVYTTQDRHAEFQAALTYKPEWIPRHVCFHTLAMIPNAVCLNLLLRLELEDDPGVTAALASLYALYKRHGGLCATNIKKPYL